MDHTRDATISRLRAALDVAEGALEPVAKAAIDADEWSMADFGRLDSDETLAWGTQNTLTLGDLRRARAALDEIRKAKG